MSNVPEASSKSLESLRARSQASQRCCMEYGCVADECSHTQWTCPIRQNIWPRAQANGMVAAPWKGSSTWSWSVFTVGYFLGNNNELKLAISIEEIENDRLNYYRVSLFISNFDFGFWSTFSQVLGNFPKYILSINLETFRMRKFLVNLHFIIWLLLFSSNR